MQARGSRPQRLETERSKRRTLKYSMAVVKLDHLAFVKGLLCLTVCHRVGVDKREETCDQAVPGRAIAKYHEEFRTGNIHL